MKRQSYIIGRPNKSIHCAKTKALHGYSVRNRLFENKPNRDVDQTIISDILRTKALDKLMEIKYGLQNDIAERSTDRNW